MAKGKKVATIGYDNREINYNDNQSKKTKVAKVGLDGSIEKIVPKKDKGNFFQRSWNTVQDAGLNLMESFLNTTEGWADWISYKGADVLDYFGIISDESADEWRDAIKRDLISEAFETDKKKEIEQKSYLNKTTRSVVQGAGNVLANMGGGRVLGVNYGADATKLDVAKSALLSYTSASGNATSEALRNGADYNTAKKAGVINGIAEAISEQFFDAMPGTKAEGWGGKLTGKVGSLVEKYFGTNTGKLVMKTLNASGEGFEEIISNMLVSTGNDIVHWLDKDFTYGMDNQTGNVLKDIGRAWTSQESWEAFLSASLTSALTNGASNFISNTQKNNIIRSYAKENNMKVSDVKKMFNQSFQQKAQNEITTKGETNLKNKTDIETAAKIQTLKEMQRGSFVEPGTETDAYKYQETDNEKVNNMNKSLERIGANNDIKTREAAALGGRLARDLGLDIEFTNKQEIEQKIKNGELNPTEGTNINGYVANGKMYLNIDSDQMVNFTVGHETKHFFEANEELNKSLNDALENYAKLKGRYEEDLARVTKTYTDKDGNLVGDPKAELMADYVGEFFTDYDFVSNLSTKNPTLFTKVRDFFQKLYYKATNQKEKLFIKQINDNINKAYREYAKTQPGKDISSAETQIISNEQSIKQEQQQEVKQKEENILPIVEEKQEMPVKEEVKEKPKKIETKEKTALKEVVDEDLFNVDLKQVENQFDKDNYNLNEYLENDDFWDLHQQNFELKDGNIIETTIPHTFDKHGNPIYQNKMEFTIVDKDGNEISSYTIEGKDNTFTKEDIIKAIKHMTYDDSNKVAEGQIDMFNNVHRSSGIQYSLSVKEANTTQDNEGRELSKEQKEYFADSMAVDENGNLITVYHTTTDEIPQFNEFNPVGTPYYRFDDQVVNYYTDSKDMSGSYANQKYDMAKTTKLNNVEEAKQWLEDNKFNGKISYDYKINTHNGVVEVDLFNYDMGNLLDSLFYRNEQDFLKKIKEDVSKVNKPVTHAIQYEGYVNITNPYIVDAEQRNWNQVISQSNEFIDDIDERVPFEIKNNLTRLYNESNNISTDSRDMYNTLQHIINNMSFKGAIDENIRKINEVIRNVGFNEIEQVLNNESIGVNGWYNLAEALESENLIGNATKQYIIDEFKLPQDIKDLIEENYNKEIDTRAFVFDTSNGYFNKIFDKNMTSLKDIYTKNNESYEQFDKYRYPSTYFMEQISAEGNDYLGNELNDLFETRAEMYGAEQVGEEIAQAASVAFSKPEMIRLWGTSKTTNDVVKEIIASNKDGLTNYDGVIIKNVYDYGGKTDIERTANDLYVTFNSNQFKAADNTTPTTDSDIRYSLSQDLDNYLDENKFTLDNNGNMSFETLTNKQIASLANMYRKTGYSDVSAEYLKSKLGQFNGLKVPREVADRFIEKELGYKPQIDTTKVFEDAEGNKLTKEQVEFYKDSGVRDIRGRLIPVYHKTNAEFTIFDKNAGKQHGNKYGKGFYFSITPENYGNNEMKVYLNAKDGEFKYIPSQGYYVVQEANQIKNVDNTNPTSDADIRYSLSQNEDTYLDELSDQQMEYFKDTKAVDKHGYLDVVFHGTPKDFTVFDINQADNVALGNGLYFTTSEGNAESYAKGTDGTEGKVLEGYVNIVNPASRTEKTLTFDNFKKLYNELNNNPEMYDEEMGMSNIDALLSDYGNVYEENIDNILKKFYDSYDNDVSLIDNLSYMDNAKEMYKTLRDVTGLDGIIAENPTGFDDKETYYIIFNPDQFKLKSNKTPTINEDMRYSLSQQGEDLESYYQDLFPIKNKVTTRLSDLKKKEVELPTEEENALKTAESEQKQGEKPTRREVIDKNRQLAREQLGDITKIKDKKRGFLYQINTMKRNLRDIMSKEQAQKMYDTYFKNVTENNAKIENEINSYNERIQKYNLNDKESTYTQMIGELKHNPETTLTQEQVNDFYRRNSNKIDQQKCENAVTEFRNIYDELINKINDTLTDNGYKPIEYRKGYFPHFIEEKATSKLGKLAEKLGWKVQKGQLPTDIAGITDQFKPGKAWTSFSQQRTGDATDYNALKGLDNYLRGAMDIVYHTNDIQKLRALENEIRYQYSSKGIQEKIDNIYSDDNLDMEEKNDAIANLTADMRGTGLGNFVTEIRNYTDNLANKKSFSDRSMEQAFGRDVYSIMNNINGRVSANMVGANISSAITNFIPITQAWGNMSTKNLLRGMYDSIKTSIKGDNFAEKSAFLTNRTKQADRLYNTKLQKINKALGVPFEAIDSFTANTIVRGKYYDNIAKGMSEQEAIKNADEFAKDVMAGRSKGDQPTMFNKKNPLVKLFTAFQLEVNNQYGYMFKDIPTDLADEAKTKLIGAFIKMFLGAWLYNEVTEKMTGRRAAFDPIDMAVSDVKTLTDENMDLGDKIQSIVKDTSQELPFVSGVMGGGRLPIQGAIPYSSPLEMVTSTLEDIGKLDDPKKRKTAINNLKKEWSKPLYYVAMPFAGGQLKKTVEGLSMYDKDLPIAGSYTNSGKLRFEADTSTLGKIQSAVFGQYASKNAREYFEKGYTPLTEGQVEEALEADLPIKEYREINQGIKNAKAEAKAEGENQTEAMYDYIYDLPISMEQKNSLINSRTKGTNTVTDDNGYIKYKDDKGKTYWYDEDSDTLYNTKYNVIYNKDVGDLTKVSTKKDLSDYGNYGSLEEFNYSNNNPDKYLALTQISDYDTYNGYKDEISAIKQNYDNQPTAVKKQAVYEYINSLPLSIEQKIMLQKMAGGYSIKQYQNQMRAYINSLDLTIEEKQSIDDVLFK